MKFRFLIAAVLLAPSISFGEPPNFEIKGIKIGMSEAEFNKVNPKAKCESPNPKFQPGYAKNLPKIRVCTIKPYSLAGVEATSTNFQFFDDRFGDMMLGVRQYEAEKLIAGFTEKFGAPRTEVQPKRMIWVFTDGAELRLHLNQGDNAYVTLFSKVNADYLTKKLQYEKAARKADL